MVGCATSASQLGEQIKKLYAQSANVQAAESSKLPKYTIENIVNDFYYTSTITEPLGGIIIYSSKDYLIRFYNSKVKNNKASRKIDIEEASDFLQSEKWDVIEVYNTNNSNTPYSKPFAILYKENTDNKTDKVYVQFDLFDRKGFFLPDGNYDVDGSIELERGSVQEICRDILRGEILRQMRKYDEVQILQKSMKWKI